MHAVHTTLGFILGSKTYGEADKMLFIFTRDFGLITAVARSIRLERSKLRYFSQDYSMGIYSLVRGKDIWRLTSAQDSSSAGEHAQSDIIARIALIIRRFLHGEEAHPELFSCVESLMSFLASNADLDQERLKALESITVYKILKSLGYIGSDRDLDPSFDFEDLTLGVIDSAVSKRQTINKHINKALKESHL